MFLEVIIFQCPSSAILDQEPVDLVVFLDSFIHLCVCQNRSLKGNANSRVEVAVLLPSNRKFHFWTRVVEA